MNRVRLWDFIEEREQHSAAPLHSFSDDITQLREFVQMMGPGLDDDETTQSSSDQ